MAVPTSLNWPEYRIKAQVNTAIMARPITQSHAKEIVSRPMKSKSPDSTYSRQIKTKSTAGVLKALNKFFD